MLPARHERRDFLKSLAALTLAGPTVARLELVEEAFGAELASVASHPRSAAAWETLRDRYMLGSDVVYLNHASIGTIPRVVHEACVEYMRVCEANPWLYMWGGAWELPRESVRGKAAELFGADPDEVAITHNTTEGFNVLAQGLPLGPGDEVLFSSMNHDGASVCWNHHASKKGYAVRRFVFPVTDVPNLTADQVVEIHRRQIRPETKVLVFPHVDNIVGLRHPMAALTAMAKREGVEFVAVDGAQTAGMIPLDLDASGVDAYAVSPHKWIQSPKGLGLLYVRREALEAIHPMWATWGQRRWAGSARMFEDYGTRNLPEVLAMGDALDFQSALGPDEKVHRYREIRDGLKARVDADPSLSWRSSESWELGASLIGIGFEAPGANAVSGGMYSDRGIVLRPFQTQGLNALRVSPNTVTSEAGIESLFAALAARS
jgi:selenocysteine lyase/cysteine desulfurase